VLEEPRVLQRVHVELALAEHRVALGLGLEVGLFHHLLGHLLGRAVLVVQVRLLFAFLFAVAVLVVVHVAAFADLALHAAALLDLREVFQEELGVLLPLEQLLHEVVLVFVLLREVALQVAALEQDALAGRDRRGLLRDLGDGVGAEVLAAG